MDKVTVLRSDAYVRRISTGFDGMSSMVTFISLTLSSRNLYIRSLDRRCIQASDCHPTAVPEAFPSWKGLDPCPRVFSTVLSGATGSGRG